jgi:seryl-tRNA synthetase
MEQEKREELIRRGQALKEELVDYEDRLRHLENALQFEAQRLPNLTHPGAAIGGEENAILLKEVGKKITPEFQVLYYASPVCQRRRERFHAHILPPGSTVTHGYR